MYLLMILKMSKSLRNLVTMKAESDNDGDEFVHPKFTTHDEEDKEEESFDLRVQTPSHYESTDDEAYDDYASSISSDFISNMLNPNPDTGIDSILKTNVELTSLVEDLPNFGSLFGFDNQLKTLEANFSEFKQTNQFATALSSILNIVDNYLGSKLKDAMDVAVQLKSDKLIDEAQVENQDFINQIVENIKKIVKEQVKIQVKQQINKILPRIEKSVNEQLEAEHLIRSTNEAQTSYAIAADSFRTHT
ncbi:hypothetical protein Tco_1419525 [Tanacetum coccineum]